MSTLGGHARTLRQLLTGLVLAIGVLTVADVALGASGPTVSRRGRLLGAGALVGLLALVAVERLGDSGDGRERGDGDADGRGSGDGPRVGTHYRATSGGSHPEAVYRVVGSEDDVTLLRVADADGRRRHTGDVVSVTQADLEAEFEAASDPDAGLAPVRAARNQLQGLYWSVRRFF